MALWQIEFVALPDQYLAKGPRLDDKHLAAILANQHKAYSGFVLPKDYRDQLAGILALAESWSPDLELWGDTKTDDFSIWRTSGRIRSIELRLDVRKLDDRLISEMLDLATGWNCTLVELEHQTVCRSFSVAQMRQLISGHVHARALRDPETWLPFLAKRAAGDDRN